MSAKTAAPKVPVALPKKEDAASASTGPPLLDKEEALKIAVGSRVRINTLTSGSIEGNLHTADPVLNWLIVHIPTSATPTNAIPAPSNPLPPPGSARVVPISQITSFQIISLPTPEQLEASASNRVSTIDPAAAQARIAKAVAAEQEKLAKKGPKGTSPSDQALFDALGRTMPARWEESRMVISDHYVIEKPYEKENVSLVDVAKGTGKQGLERVRNIVGMERAKVELKMKGAPGMGALKGSPKKGG